MFKSKLFYFSFLFSLCIISNIINITFINQKLFTNSYGQSTLGPDTSQLIPANSIKSYKATSLFTNKPVSITNSTKHLILLNSWATWCIPCREEMPAIEKLYKIENPKGLDIIGINVDGPGSEDAVKSFTQKYNLTYTFWYDPDNNFAQVFKSMGVPESFLIDNTGKILHQWRGQFDPIAAETKEIINTALVQQSPTSSKSLTVKSNTNVKGNSISQIGIPIAFTAGVLSFFSPCILPIIPSFIAFITGMSSDELLRRNNNNENVKNSDYVSGPINNKKETKYIEKASIIKSRTFIRSCLFILGFSIVFVALGASLTAIGSAFQQYNRWIEIIGGIIIIGFGLNLIGILKIPGAQRDRGYKFSTRPAGHIGSLLIGMGFGAGWTPCIGPILASILTMAAITTSIYQGILLLIVYSIGLAIPFIISSLAIDKYIKTIKRIRKWIPWIHRISVTLLMIMGILLLTGYLTLITNSISSLFPLLG